MSTELIAGIRKPGETGSLGASVVDAFWRYGTENGRRPSVGKMPVGVVTVEGCERNM
jgi:hypothetical protein